MTYVVWVQVPPPVPKIMDIKELKNTDKLVSRVVSHNTFFKDNIELDKKYFELMNKVNLPGLDQESS